MIALDIAQAFERAGAEVALMSTLQHAFVLVENDGLAAAVLDHALGDGDSSPLCTRLRERELPFVIYSGLGKLAGPCAAGAHVSKPEKPEVLVTMIERLLSGEKNQNQRPR